MDIKSGRHFTLERVRISSHPVRVLALLGLLACGDNPTAPKAGPPAKLDIISGQDQTGVVGTELGTALRVLVLDANDRPVGGQAVNFKVISGGGEMFAGVGITTSDGVVVDRWTLGTSTADSQRVEARAVDPNTGEKLVFAIFRAVAKPDVPATLTKIAGDAQAGAVGTPLTDSLAVKVTDKYGNVVPGTTITWAVPSGGGSVSPTSSQTDSTGIARTKWTVGLDGSSAQNVTASFAPLPPAQFSATITAGKYSITLSPASPAAGSTVTLSAQFASAAGVAIPTSGLVVMWSAAKGTFSSPTSTTNAAGVATAQYTADTVAGTATTIIGADANHATGSITVTPVTGPAAKLVFLTQPGNTGWSTVFSPAPAVAVQDAYGNRVTSSTSPVSLSFVTNPGGSTISGNDATPTNGVATFSSLLLDQPGNAYSLRATSAGLQSVASSPFNIAAIATIATVPDSLLGVVATSSSVFFTSESEQRNGLFTLIGCSRVRGVSITGGATRSIYNAGVKDNCELFGPILFDGANIDSRDGGNGSMFISIGPMDGAAGTACCRGSTINANSDLSRTSMDFDFDGAFFYQIQVYLDYTSFSTIFTVFRESSATGSRKVLFSRSADAEKAIARPFLTLSGGQVYFTDSTAAEGLSIWRVPVDSGARMLVASGIGPREATSSAYLWPAAKGNGWRKMIVVGGYVYWAGSGVIKRAPAAGGGNIETVLTLPVTHIANFRTDGSFLYFIADGSVHKMSLSGFSDTVLLPNADAVDIAIDGRVIYWTTTQSVKKMRF